MTDDPRVLAVLEEIRDVQHRHFELYERAVANQEASIRAQEEAIRFQKSSMRRVMLVALPLIAIVLGLLLWLMLVFR